MNEVLTRIQAIFSPGDIAEHVFGRILPDLVVAGLVFLVSYMVWRMLDRGVTLVLRRAELDQTATRFILVVLRYGVMTIGVVAALGQLGVDTGSLLASLGVAGLTIGFAAKDALSNVIAGLFIFWDRPFVIGDLVEVDGKYGKVETITMRSTRVVTVDGRMLAIPNTIIVNSTVASYTNFPNIRLDVEVTVGVNEDIGRIRAAMLAAIAQEQKYLQKPAPQVVLKAINDYNLLLEVRAWLEDETQHIAERFALRELVLDVCRAENIELPFETIALAPIEVMQRA